jgi:hypothetical protein
MSGTIDAELSGRDTGSTGVPAASAEVPTAVPSPGDDGGPVEPVHNIGDGSAEPTPADHADPHVRRQVADGATRAQMEALARAALAAGDRITGAGLDRRFGTRDYGRRVLREVLAATGRTPATRLEKILTPTGADRDDAA